MMHGQLAEAHAPRIGARTEEGRFGLWLFLALAIVTVAIAWFNNEFILTRSVFHQLLDARLDAARIDEHFDLTRRMTVWGYVAAPLIVLLRLVVVAMTAQLILLLFRDVSFAVVWRAASWAYVAVLVGLAARALYLFLLPLEEISQASMQVVPGSVASLVMYPQDYKSPLYVLLGLVNVFELAWGIILYQSLRARGGPSVSPAAALSATAGTWTLLAVLQWAFTAYMASLS